MQYTFSMIKPDAVERNLTGKINSCLEEAGLKIVAQRMCVLTKNQAKEFYKEHNQQSFFNSLIEQITSGPVVLQVLKGDNAISRNRDVMGATNPKDAGEGTIRKKFGVDIDKNSVHGSDSISSAAREISLFFAKFDIV